MRYVIQKGVEWNEKNRTQTCDDRIFHIITRPACQLSNILWTLYPCYIPIGSKLLHHVFKNFKCNDEIGI